MDKYWYGSQSKHRLMYHLVWIPKYRKRVLKGKVAERIKELLHECADLNRWKVEELKYSTVQRHDKQDNERTIFWMKEFFCGGNSFWSDGYFSETSGQS